MLSNAHERTETLEQLLAAIDALPALSPTDELAACRRAAGGDQAAVRTVTLANLGRVVHVAREYRSSGLPLEDLIHEGALGLLEALPRFDADRGVRFFTYASFLVRRRIVQALARGTKTVRVPRQVAARIRRFRAERDRLRARSDGTPVDAETVARSLGLRAAPHGGALAASFAAPFEISIDEPLPDSTSTRADLLSTDERPPDERLQAAQELRELRLALSALPARERRILEERFGLNGTPPRTLRELAGMLDLSKERVRQLEERAKSAVRAHLRTRRSPPEARPCLPHGPAGGPGRVAAG